jgi:DNA-nicking Smr family endonuclease
MKPRKPTLETPLPAEEIAVFRDAVSDATPLPPHGKAQHPPRRRKPVPQQALPDERQAAGDSLSDHISSEAALDGDEEQSFLRPGMSRQDLRKLRRGHWGNQGELDLHGMTSDEARQSLVEFLNHAQEHSLRCVRIIHGKGLSSKNREPVLKNKVRSWLMQRGEVLAFTEARPVDGGGGAVVVLLKVGG